MADEESDQILSEPEMNELFNDLEKDDLDKKNTKKYRFPGDIAFYIFLVIGAIILIIVSVIFDFFWSNKY